MRQRKRRSIQINCPNVRKQVCSDMRKLISTGTLRARKESQNYIKEKSRAAENFETVGAGARAAQAFYNRRKSNNVLLTTGHSLSPMHGGANGAPVKPGTAPGTSALPRTPRVQYTPVSVQDLRLIIPGKHPLAQDKGDGPGNLYKKFATADRDSGSNAIVIRQMGQQSKQKMSPL